MRPRRGPFSFDGNRSWYHSVLPELIANQRNVVDSISATDQ
mgnify:CR=1 FL=1